MKLVNAIKEFTSRYSRDAIQALDEGSIFKVGVVDAINLKEAFDKFNQYIRGYGEYKIINENVEEATSQENIKLFTNKWINEKLIQPKHLSHMQISSYIESYLHGIQDLIKACDETKSKMILESIENTCVGDIDDFCEMFIDKINESFYNTVDTVLDATWQRCTNSLKNIKPNNHRHMFL